MPKSQTTAHEPTKKMSRKRWDTLIAHKVDNLGHLPKIHPSPISRNSQTILGQADHFRQPGPEPSAISYYCIQL